MVGPIRLPLKNKHYTVNRSPHLHKKSRDQFLFTRFSVLYVVKAKLNVPEGASPEITYKLEEKIQMYFFKVMSDIKENNPINVTVSYYKTIPGPLGAKGTESKLIFLGLR